MISYVNEHLFDVVSTGNGIWSNSGENYERFAIKTSDMVIQSRDGSEPSPSQRILAMYNDAGKGNTRIVSTRGGEHNALRVTVRRSTDTKFDSDVFMIAIPFSGFIIPVSETDDLDIFKATVMRSDQYFDHIDGERYKKILYAIVRPYHKACNHGIYNDSADFVVQFAQSNRTRKDQDTSKLKWKMQTTRVKFGTNGEYHITRETTEIPFDQFNPEDINIKVKNLFPIVEPKSFDKK